ncbi:sugar-transfer associated ATP-grasp domain-containing protein [Dongia sp. agr-C8]
MQIWFYPPPMKRRAPAGPELAYAEVIRLNYRQVVWRRAEWHQRMGLWLATATWPAWALLEAARLSIKLGGRVARETGKSRLSQFGEQLRLARRHLIPPSAYYMFELYLDDHRRRADEYLLRAETKGGAFFLLRPRDFDPGRRRPFRDKASFAMECAAAGLRAAPVLARFEKGKVRARSAEALPPIDLFVKLAEGKGGRGAECWRYEQGRWRRGRLSLDEAGLMAHLADHSRVGPLLLQPRLFNHPDLADINLGTLSTFRVVTALDEQERPELIGAVLRMPSRADSAVDNFHAGGIAAPVDPATGRLGAASDMGLKPSTRWHAVHPVTGGQIEGRVVPYWPEVMALVAEAHAKLGERVVIGWDVAVLEDGPAIVEANGLPDQDILQRIHKAPLGAARLGQLLAHHLTYGTRWRKP